MTDIATALPAKAGARRDARKTLPAWNDILRALARGLCLADPWVPAFAGTTEDRERWARLFAETDET
jgi:hypothetical protein